MAYGNWGGNAFRNGERMTDWEDSKPYRETPELRGQTTAAALEMHHVVLGCQRVRFCGYKYIPFLYLDGVLVDLSRYQTDEDGKAGKGEIEGYNFGWKTSQDPRKVDLWLTEPDGTKWTGFSGFEMGAGWDSD